MEVMAEAKAAITKNLNQALKDEAREAAQGTDASDWEARNKDANAAQIETEYLEQRNQALELLDQLVRPGSPDCLRSPGSHSDSSGGAHAGRPDARERIAEAHGGPQQAP